MRTPRLFPLLLVPLLLLLTPSTSQCCLAMDPTHQYCLSCPQGTHLYQDNCLLDIAGCTGYAVGNGFDCEVCETGWRIVEVQRSGYVSRRC